MSRRSLIPGEISHFGHYLLELIYDMADHWVLVQPHTRNRRDECERPLCRCYGPKSYGCRRLHAGDRNDDLTYKCNTDLIDDVDDATVYRSVNHLHV